MAHLSVNPCKIPPTNADFLTFCLAQAENVPLSTPLPSFDPSLLTASNLKELYRIGRSKYEASREILKKRGESRALKASRLLAADPVPLSNHSSHPTPTEAHSDDQKRCDRTDHLKPGSVPFHFLCECQLDTDWNVWYEDPPYQFPDHPLFAPPRYKEGVSELEGVSLSKVLKILESNRVENVDVALYVRIVSLVWTVALASLVPLHSRNLVHGSFDLEKVLLISDGRFSIGGLDAIPPDRATEVAPFPLEAPLERKEKDKDGVWESTVHSFGEDYEARKRKVVAEGGEEDEVVFDEGDELAQMMEEHAPNFSHRIAIGKNPLWRDDIEAAFLSTLKLISGEEWPAKDIRRFGTIMPTQYSPHYRAGILIALCFIPDPLLAWASPICSFLGY